MEAKIDNALLAREAPSNTGARYTNHVGCPAGEDHKRRLWVKRNEDGSVTGFCHHCGGHGYLRNAARNGPVVQQKVIREMLPRTELEYDDAKWPPEARGWLLKYGINQSEVDASYHENTRRLILSMWGANGPRIGQQGRSLDKFHEPKYLTWGNSNAGSWYSPHHEDGDGDDLVIVEDMLSAAKVSRYVPAVALLRTVMSPEVLSHILTRGYGRAILWFDPDSAGQEATRKVGEQLRPFMEVVEIHTAYQPKEATDAQIQEAVLGPRTAAVGSNKG